MPHGVEKDTGPELPQSSPTHGIVPHNMYISESDALPVGHQADHVELMELAEPVAPGVAAQAASQPGRVRVDLQVRSQGVIQPEVLSDLLGNQSHPTPRDQRGLEPHALQARHHQPRPGGVLQVLRGAAHDLRREPLQRGQLEPHLLVRGLRGPGGAELRGLPARGAAQNVVDAVGDQHVGQAEHHQGVVLGLRQIVVPAQDGLCVVLVAHGLQVHMNVCEVHSPRAGDSENHSSVSPLLHLNAPRLAPPADKHINQAVNQGRRRARRVQHYPADRQRRLHRVHRRCGDRGAGARLRGPSGTRWNSRQIRIV
mmetsp:Transcript_85667/g.229221  ORF Transcript_85667/g.229221 Transcript_85667/m.229221 type:complete len:312 (+) Transcript_85667:1662-2597(+)